MARTDTEPVVLGRVSGLFGVRGWVKIHSYTEPREALLGYADWQLEKEDHWQPIAVAEGKPHGKTLIARFEGIDDRDAAAELIGARIAVARNQLPATGPGQFYWTDLVGLRVLGTDGRLIGEVACLLETGANDVLVVRDGKRETLIPFVYGPVIRDVDLAGGEIRVDWEWE